MVFLSMAVLPVMFALPVLCQDVKEYMVAKVFKTAPVIDGKYTEEEWAGSTWTGDFVGTRHSFNDPAFWSEKGDTNYRWRALWDEDYLYVLITGDLKYLNPNGMYWDPNTGTDAYFDPSLTPEENALSQDDVANDRNSWNKGTCLDFEVFIVPSWTEDLGNDTTTNPAGYQFVYFPIKELKDAGGKVVNPSNFGIRDAAGPPFFAAGYTGNGAFTPVTVVVDPAVPTVDWQPITGAGNTQLNGLKPLLLGSQPNEIAGAKVGTDVVAQPVMEFAFPFSQFSLNSIALTFTYPDPNDPTVNITEKRYATADDVYAPSGGENLFLTKDAQGHWVKVGTKWLFQICAYTDGVRASEGLALVNWNDMVDGGFHNWPKGIMTFSAAVGVGSWMLY